MGPDVIAELNLPGTIVVGGGASRQLPEQVRRLGLSRVLLVTDPGIVRLGLAGRLADALYAEGIACTVFDGVQPDPTDANVYAALEAIRASGAEGLVAIGGGSPIDAAKAAGMLAANPGTLPQFEGRQRVPRPSLPLVAIPTTAGTGSECTKVAVITDMSRDVKMMILDAHLTPRVALVDYELSLTMPPELTAAVGVDTLTHGIEAYVSAQANPLTDPLALSCVRLVGKFLRRAFVAPDDAEARQGMMLAACQGGMAFPNSSVCLVHGMSRPIGAVFHVPHGLSNAVLLPTVTRWTLTAAVDRYATLSRALGCATHRDDDRRAAEALVEELERLNVDLQIPRLREIAGVDAARFEALLGKMADDALASGSPANNPRVPSRDEIVALYRQAW